MAALASGFFLSGRSHALLAVVSAAPNIYRYESRSPHSTGPHKSSTECMAGRGVGDPAVALRLKYAFFGSDTLHVVQKNGLGRKLPLMGPCRMAWSRAGGLWLSGQVRNYSPGFMEQAPSRGNEAIPHSGLGASYRPCSSSKKAARVECTCAGAAHKRFSLILLYGVFLVPVPPA
jgi:hypothetical protein